jgi:hypothetical protein
MNLHISSTACVENYNTVPNYAIVKSVSLFCYALFTYPVRVVDSGGLELV